MAKKTRSTVKKRTKSAKSQTKASKKGLTKRSTILDNLPRNREEYLELLIRMTERHIKPGSANTTMSDQAERLKKQLAELRASK